MVGAEHARAGRGNARSLLLPRPHRTGAERGCAGYRTLREVAQTRAFVRACACRARRALFEVEGLHARASLTGNGREVESRRFEGSLQSCVALRAAETTGACTRRDADRRA